jgi:hypothetical protein
MSNQLFDYILGVALGCFFLSLVAYGFMLLDRIN